MCFMSKDLVDRITYGGKSKLSNHAKGGCYHFASIRVMSIVSVLLAAGTRYMKQLSNCLKVILPGEKHKAGIKSDGQQKVTDNNVR